jgi:hypothetical protein
MRGSDAASGALFSYVDMEARVPATHPLRTIRTIVNEVLDALDTEFEALYEGTGRQSVAPERLLRASLLQAFYSVRSDTPSICARRPWLILSSSAHACKARPARSVRVVARRWVWAAERKRRRADWRD